MTEREKFKDVNKMMDKMRDDGFNITMNINREVSATPYFDTFRAVYDFDYEYDLGSARVSVQGRCSESIYRAFVHCIQGYKRYKNYKKYRKTITKK